jgi:hypothetical protein
MKDFKVPDLHAPRYRPRTLEIANTQFFKEFKEAHPEYADIPNAELKEKLKTINGAMWRTVLDERDGLELPNGLGYMFLGSCPKKEGDNTDYATSAFYQKHIQHRNFESDNYTAKIFYTNYSSKYRFRNHELWGFTAVRGFKRAVKPTYQENWTKYILVDNMQRVSELFRRNYHRLHQKQLEQELIKTYDEFELD